MKYQLNKYVLWFCLFVLSLIVSSCFPSLFQLENASSPIQSNFIPVDNYADSLIKKYGWDEHFATRWPNGPIEVFDMTGYSGLQNILDQWNDIIGGTTYFHLSFNPFSPIIISVDYTLSQFQSCGYTEVYIGENSMIYGAVISILPDENICPSYSTLLHEFGHVVGFGKHTNDRCAMDSYNIGNIRLSDTVRTMVNRLYQIPVGCYLP